MLELYRRHTEACPHKAKGQNHTKCSCPIWIYGEVHGGKVRRSLKTKDWQRAVRRIDKLEKGSDEPQPIKMKAAVERYLADCKSRKLASSTVVSYENVLEPMAGFLSPESTVNISPSTLSDFRTSRDVSASTSRKELQCLRAFFAFCIRHKWLSENPAKAIKAPKENHVPTLPFSHDEVRRIIEACDRMTNFNLKDIERTRRRAKALVLLLLYSGLRISDAVQLKRSKLGKDRRLLVRMMKTGQPLYVRLGAECVQALNALPVESEYFFWSGNAKLSTAVGSSRRTIDCLMRLAGIEDGHPHRFRDTFAVELLLSRVNIRSVQLLLGHQSIKITEKHYAPFVAGTQKLLDDATSKLDFTLNGLGTHAQQHCVESATPDVTSGEHPQERRVSRLQVRRKTSERRKLR